MHDYKKRLRDKGDGRNKYNKLGWGQRLAFVGGPANVGEIGFGCLLAKAKAGDFHDSKETCVI